MLHRETGVTLGNLRCHSAASGKVKYLWRGGGDLIQALVCVSSKASALQ